MYRIYFCALQLNSNSCNSSTVPTNLNLDQNELRNIYGQIYTIYIQFAVLGE